MDEPIGQCSLCGEDASSFPRLRHLFAYLYQDQEGRAHQFNPRAQPYSKSERVKRGYDEAEEVPDVTDERAPDSIGDTNHGKETNS